MINKRGRIGKNFVLMILVVTVFFLTTQTLSAYSNLSSETPLEKWQSNLSDIEKGILQKNVQKYDSRILEEFAKLKYPEINQTNDTTTNETFIKIIIYLKNTSEADEILSAFSSNELKDIINRQISDRISVKITEPGFYKLIQDDRVDKVYFARKGYFLLNESAPLINADNAWNTLGYTGEGVKVCVIDSGVDKYHSSLSGKIVAEKCYCSDNCCPGGVSESNNASDDLGHGTHVVGIIASQDPTYKGIAYDSNIYIVKVGGALGGPDIDPDVGDAIDWCISQGVNVISISIGDEENHPQGSPCPEGIKNSIDNATSHNISVIIASGNEGYTTGINYPACSPNAISVGATYDDDLGWWDSLKYELSYGCWNWANKDEIACFTDKGANLDLLAPGADITSTKMGGGFYTDAGTSMATPHVAGAAALLLEKDPTLTPSGIKTTLQNTGVTIENWKRINVEAALNSICTCTSWQQVGGCGDGSCDSDEKHYTRSCDPSSCDDESKCEYDSSCDTGPPSGVVPCDYYYEYNEDCPSGYEAIDHDCYWSGNNWECKLTCWRDEYCGSYGSWSSESISCLNKPSGSWCYTNTVDESSNYCYQFYTNTEVNPPLGPSIYATAATTWDTSSTSCTTFRPVSISTPTYTHGRGVNGNGHFGGGKWTLCSGSLSSTNVDVDFYYKTATYYPEDTDYLYCDVPYTYDIDIDSTIYGDLDADCYVEVRGSYSNPDKIQVKWYVNGDYKTSETCDVSGGDACDDHSGTTWSNTFTLSQSYFSKDDEVYCIGRGYGEDGGHGAYEQSSTTIVSNRVPTWSSVSLDKSYAKQGDNIKATANGEADLDSDVLAMYCCNGDSCTPSTSNHDFCYATGDGTPYDLYCVGQGVNGTGTQTIRCRAYDGEDYSTIQSDTYIINESEEDNPPITNLVTPTNNSIDEDGIVVFNCSATDDNNLVNITLYGNWGGIWDANETKSLSGTSDSATFTKILNDGIYEWNCLAYDNASQGDWNDANWTINISINNTPPTTPTSLLCNNEPCTNNSTFSGSIEINCSGSTDEENNSITYFIDSYYNLTEIGGGGESDLIGYWKMNETTDGADEINRLVQINLKS